MSKRVLVIDDDAELRATFRAVLEGAGYEVEVARNGREGLEQLEHHDPCLILLDLMMPVMSGPEFLEALHERERDAAVAEIPVVIISAYGNLADPSAGVAGFVAKPCSMEALLECANRYCGRCAGVQHDAGA